MSRPLSDPLFLLRKSLLALAALLSLSFAHAADEMGGDRFVVEVTGNGRAVIFIPGLTSSPDVFAAAQEKIYVEAHLITPAGFDGVPAPAPLTPFIDSLAADIVRYLNDEDISDAAIVGHSMGGLTALLVAAKSDRVSAVMVIDSVPFLPRLFQPSITPEQVDASRAVLATQMAALSDEAYLDLARQGLPRQAMKPEDQSRIMEDVTRADINAAKAAFIELMSTDYTPQLSSIDASVTVTVLVPFDPMTGFSRDLLLARYEEQYTFLEQVELHIVENARHFIMLDQPAVFHEELEQFLNKNGKGE
ncbi:alpha/beta fold hydrolase [Parvularcula marina]|uniref:alpha/beta fold hydrolase n=1 Tax=Parvularcula marina TaxID=2292771 RepID=UPI003513327F